LGTDRIEERVSTVERIQEETREMVDTVAEEMTRAVSACKAHIDATCKDMQKEVMDIVDDRIASYVNDTVCGGIGDIVSSEINEVVDSRISSLTRELASKVTEVVEVVSPSARHRKPRIGNDGDSSAIFLLGEPGHDRFLSEHNSDEDVARQHEQARLAVKELLTKLGDLNACMSNSPQKQQPNSSLINLTALHNMVKTTAEEVRRLQQQCDREGDKVLAVSPEKLQHAVEGGSPDQTQERRTQTASEVEASQFQMGVCDDKASVEDDSSPSCSREPYSECNTPR